MNYVKMISIVLLCGVSAANANVPVEYVRICEINSNGSLFYGATLPGTGICLNLSTGVQKQNTASGVVTTQSVLLQRISALEAELAALEKQFGISQPE